MATVGDGWTFHSPKIPPERSTPGSSRHSSRPTSKELSRDGLPKPVARRTERRTITLGCNDVSDETTSSARKKAGVRLPYLMFLAQTTTKSDRVKEHSPSRRSLFYKENDEEEENETAGSGGEAGDEMQRPATDEDVKERRDRKLSILRSSMVLKLADERVEYVPLKEYAPDSFKSWLQHEKDPPHRQRRQQKILSLSEIDDEGQQFALSLSEATSPFPNSPGSPVARLSFHLGGVPQTSSPQTSSPRRLSSTFTRAISGTSAVSFRRAITTASGVHCRHISVGSAVCSPSTSPRAQARAPIVLSPKGKARVQKRKADKEAKEAEETKYAGSTFSEIQQKMDASRRKAFKTDDVLKLFKRGLIKRYGTLASAWQAMDENGDGKLQFHEFVAACRRIDFSGNLKQCWEQMTNCGENYLEPEMLDDSLPQDLQRLQKTQTCEVRDVSLDKLAKLSAQGHVAVAQRGTAYNAGKFLGATTMAEISAMLARQTTKAPPCSDARGFTAALLKKFHVLERAWHVMDTNADNAIQFHEFVHACRRINFGGNLKKIFIDLAKGKKELEPGDFGDPNLLKKVEKIRTDEKRSHQRQSHEVSGADTIEKNFRKEGKVAVRPCYNHGRKTNVDTAGEVRLLQSRQPYSQREAPPPCCAETFKACATQCHGSLVYVWEALDRKGDGIVRFSDFAAECRRLGIGGNLKDIFEELGAVDERLLPENLHPDLPSQLEARSEVKAKQSPATTGSTMMATSCHSRDSRPAWGKVSHQRSVDGSDCGESKKWDCLSFKEILLQRYQRLDRAWLDIDLNLDYSLSFHEFTQACRRISFGGNLRKIFDQLTDGAENLLPQHLDPKLPKLLEQAKLEKLQDRQNSSDADEDLSWLELRSDDTKKIVKGSAVLFKAAVVKQWGSFEHWLDEVDGNGNGTLSLKEFEKAIREMNYGHNPRPLFEELAGVGEEVLPPDKLDPGLGARLAALRAKKEKFKGRQYQHGRKCCCETAAEVVWMNSRPSGNAPPASTAKGFKAALIKTYGSLQYAWQEMDSNGDGSLQFHEFISACRRMQFQGNLKKIFNELAVDGELAMEDLDPILRRAKQTAEAEDKRAEEERLALQEERQQYLRTNLKNWTKQQVQEHNNEVAHSLFKDFTRTKM